MVRRLHVLVIVGVLALVTTAGLCLRRGQDLAEPEPTEQARPTYRVRRVIDGDTIEIVDAGGIETLVRFRSIDAPELDEPGGPEAKAALEEKMLGKDVWVTPYTRDRYGRLIADVVLSDQEQGRERDYVIATGVGWKITDVVLSGLMLLVVIGSVIVLGRQIRGAAKSARLQSTYSFLFDHDINPLLDVPSDGKQEINIYDQDQTYATLDSELCAADKRRMRALLNYFGNMCLAMKHNVIDEDIVFDSLYIFLLEHVRWARPYIEEVRKIDPEIWTELEPFVERWGRRRQEIREKAARAGP